MKITPTSLFATATVASVSSAAYSPWADIFEAIAKPVDVVTRETITDQLPQAKDESPFVQGTDLIGRGWDAAWSTWAGGDEEKWNTGIRTSINAEFSISWTAPLWASFEHGYESTFRMINFEPTFNLDAGAYLVFDIHLYFINFEFSVNLMPYMFRPFDFTFSIDPVFPRRYCYGFDYWTKGFAL